MKQGQLGMKCFQNLTEQKSQKQLKNITKQGNKIAKQTETIHKHTPFLNSRDQMRWESVTKHNFVLAQHLAHKPPPICTRHVC